jgi:hypothetical protein
MNQMFGQTHNRFGATLPGAASAAETFFRAPRMKYSPLTVPTFVYFSKAPARSSETPTKLRFSFHAARTGYGGGWIAHRRQPRVGFPRNSSSGNAVTFSQTAQSGYLRWHHRASTPGGKAAKERNRLLGRYQPGLWALTCARLLSMVILVGRGRVQGEHTHRAVRFHSVVSVNGASQRA